MKNMNNLNKTLAVAAAFCAVSAASQASTVTSGYMTRAAGSDTIIDTLNNRTWLGADVTKGLDFAQTLAALGVGGRFDGYKIAHFEDAAMYTQAITGGTATCQDYDYGYGYNQGDCQGSGSTATKQVFGESYVNYRGQYGYYGYNYGYDFDYMFFLSDAGQSASLSQGVGLAQLYSDDEMSSLSVNQRWSDVTSANYYAGGSESIGWMLYRNGTQGRDVGDVPEPGTFALAALAVLGVALTRRRRAVVGS